MEPGTGGHLAAGRNPARGLVCQLQVLQDPNAAGNRNGRRTTNTNNDGNNNDKDYNDDDDDDELITVTLDIRELCLIERHLPTIQLRQ